MGIAVPAFKAHYRAVAVPDDGALLLWEGGAYALRGEAFAQVTPLIDGRRSAEAIVLELSGTLDPALAWTALMTLESDGHLVESSTQENSEEAAFWWSLHVDPAAAVAAIDAAQVRVFAHSLSDAEQFREALSRFNIAALPMSSIEPVTSSDATGESSDSSLHVVLTDDYLSDDLVQADLAAREAGQRWLPVRLSGTRIWIGPLFEPGGVCCLDCLRRRLQHLRPAHRMAARFDPSRGTTEPLGSIPGSRETASMIAAAEIAKWLSGAAPDLVGAIRTFDLGNWSSRVHRVIPHPNCSNCGKAGNHIVGPPKLKQTQDRFRSRRRLENHPASGDGPHLQALDESTDGPHRLLDSRHPLKGSWVELCRGRHRRNPDAEQAFASVQNVPQQQYRQGNDR